jgi:hypothetical protein
MSDIPDTDISPDNIDPGELAQAMSWPPIPDSECVKGNTLTPNRLVELGAMSGDPTSGKWAFRLLALRDELMRKHRVSVKIHKGGLHINTDAEASEYHNGRGEQAVVTIKRQVSCLHSLVDPSRLSPAQQAAHDRSLCIWGAKLAGLKRATKALPAPPQNQ